MSTFFRTEMLIYCAGDKPLTREQRDSRQTPAREIA
jgi:hypothetical protein